MRKFIFLLSILGLILSSCTKDKTDYESELNKPSVEEKGFKEVLEITKDKYKIRLQAINGMLYTGFNNMRLTFEVVSNGEKVFPTEVHFQPIYSDLDGNKSSCPHTYVWHQNNESREHYEGYAVFNTVTSTDNRLDIYIDFKINGEVHQLKQAVTIAAQPNKNLGMTEFKGNDEEHYYLTLIEPQQPKVGENALVAGLFKFKNPSNQIDPTSFPNPELFSYPMVNNYTIELDPRMPDPSMGNHSSPNNKNLIQRKDGFYQGVVNYTMTGNWALNFIVLDDKGQIQRGTKVPTEFTPGVEGVRSELYIDILF